jgi:metallo-beta-lactamase family protein
MALGIEFHGAARQVTGSLYVVRTGKHTVLLECGLVQGGKREEMRNAEPFPVSPASIDAVILSHAHIDHSGRIPLLVKQGYRGPVYAQRATRALCGIMLPDSGYLNEKDAQWENKRRSERNEDPVEPLYTRTDAEACLSQFEGIRYDSPTEILPGLTVTFHDAGHILGSAIVELSQRDSTGRGTIVFSGDLGHRDAPVMNPPARLAHADAVLMESTYGDRLHRPFAETLAELADVFRSARASRGNILIPAFTVGRTQDLLYLMAENYEEWGLADWQIFLDSPMAIDATRVYGEYRHLYGARLFGPESNLPDLDNFHMTHTTEESMLINGIEAGAIVIAGSGMLSGGRIHHHLKNNIWKPGCHLVIVGYQAYGTLGRRIVDGVEEIRLWGDTYPVRASVHTIGGLSAHADRDDLVDWYAAFEGKPPVYLVHGEERAQSALAATLRQRLGAEVSIPEPGYRLDVNA